MSIPRAIKDFDDHLDACRQCREHPFELCRTGERLLGAGVDGSTMGDMLVQAKRQEPPS